VKGDVSDRVREATRDLMAGLNLELVDVEYSRQQQGPRSLRLSIDRPSGVTVDDCARVSEMVGKVLEREDIIRESYVLEVMSPGLDRPLRMPEEFVASIGKKVRLKLDEPVEGRRRYSGRILSAGDGSFRLSVGEEVMDISCGNVLSARLDPELPW